MTPQTIIRFSERMEKLPPYLFGTINKLKMQKRRSGLDIIDLGMGNPTDPAPAAVTEKLCQVANDPKSHRYPVATGLAQLKREIALKYGSDYGVSLNGVSDIICTIGSKEGISHLCLALLGPEDTVLVPEPYFPVHVYAAVIAGAAVMTTPFDSEEGFLRHLDQLSRSAETRPKLVMLNFPHNPTGKTVSADFFGEVVTLAERYGFMVVNDFAYGKINFDGYVAPSFLQTPGAEAVGVEFGSFSKSYNMAGLRLGYCAGNAEIIAGLEKIKGYYDYGVFSAIQTAGIIALRECDATIRIQSDKYARRRDVLCDGLCRNGWEIERPRAGMFVWAKIPDMFAEEGRVNAMAVAIRLMNEAHVAVAPGTGFGSAGEGYLRLALVENRERLRQAVRQMRRLSA